MEDTQSHRAARRWARRALVVATVAGVGGCNAILGIGDPTVIDASTDEQPAPSSGSGGHLPEAATTHDATMPPGDSASPAPADAMDAGASTDAPGPGDAPEAGASEAGVCTPSATPAACDKLTPEFCNTNGQWQDVATGACAGNAPVCLDGSCVECTPDPTPSRCVSGVPQACDPTGRWQSADGGACAGSTPACLNGACGTCTPNTTPTTCSVNTPQFCNASGGYQDVASGACTAATPVCLNGACVTCSPNATPTKCASNVPQYCTNLGLWQSVGGGACSGATPTCAGGSCVCGYTICNNTCVDTSHDLSYCGSCSIACAGHNASWTCSASACHVAGCATGWGDCNGLPGDGCEHDVTADGANCGACGKTCPSGLCKNSACIVVTDYGLYTPGSSNQPIASGTLAGVQINVTTAGTVTGLGLDVVSGNPHAYLGLYSDKNGFPSVLLAKTAELNLVPGRNENTVVTQTPVTANTKYWLLVVADAQLLFSSDGTSVTWFVESGYGFGVLPGSTTVTTTGSANNPVFYAIVQQ